jgi:ribosomal protein L37AE/L43A
MSEEKPRTKIRFLDLDKYLGTPSLAAGESEKKDELDEAIRKAAERKVQKLKMLELDRYLLETEKEIKDLKGEGKEEKASQEAKSEVTPEVAIALAKLPDEQRQLVISTYSMLKGAEKGEGAMAYMLPMLIGFARANPQAGQNDMVKFAEVVSNQIKTGMELARQSQPQQQSSFDPIALVKTFAEVIRDNVQKPLEEVVQRIQPQPSALEQILLDDKLFERAKTLGMFGGGQSQGTSPEIMLEIEKLRTERELKMREMEQAHHKWLAEQQLEQRKWEQIGQIIQGPVGNVLQTIGTAGADRIRGGKTSSQQIPNVKVEQVQCPKCGKPFYANTLSDVAVCANCGAVLTKAPSGAEKQSEQTEQQGEAEQQQ